MKLMEATRIGCALRPAQAFCTLDDGHSACWIGSVELGYVGGHLFFGPIDLPKWLSESLNGECPDCEEISFTPVTLGIHLNDCHGWSREAISLYLSQWEPPESEPEQEPESELEGVAV